MEPSEDFFEIAGGNVQIMYCEVFHGPEKGTVKVCIRRYVKHVILRKQSN